MKTLVYLIGSAGSGKSTLMRHLTARCTRTQHAHAPLPHELLHRHGTTVAAELGLTTGTTQHGGYDRADYPGTDCLRRDIGPTARKNLDSLPAPLLLGEGHRLTTAPFLEYAHRHTRLAVGYLRTPLQVALERVRARATPQGDQWVRSGLTKAERAAARLDAAGVRVIDLPADTTPDACADILTGAVPELEALR